MTPETEQAESKITEPRSVYVIGLEHAGEKPKGKPVRKHPGGPNEGHFEGVEQPDGTLTW